MTRIRVTIELEVECEPKNPEYADPRKAAEALRDAHMAGFLNLHAMLDECANPRVTFGPAVAAEAV